VLQISGFEHNEIRADELVRSGFQSQLHKARMRLRNLLQKLCVIRLGQNAGRQDRSAGSD